MVDKFIQSHPILRLWKKHKIPIEFGTDTKEDESKKVLIQAEILLQIQREYEEAHVSVQKCIRDLTFIYLRSSDEKACTPEGLEFSWVNSCTLTNGFYSYSTQKIILFPFSENFYFPRTYFHELIHALEDAYCQLESVREVATFLRKIEIREAKLILKCAHLLVNVPPLYYDNENEWTWSLLLQNNIDDLQDEEGDFLHDPIFLELSAFSFEFVLSLWEDEKITRNNFSTVLQDRWKEQKKAIEPLLENKNQYQSACLLVSLSMQSLLQKMQKWAAALTHSPAWLHWMLTFQDMLKKV